LPFGRGVLDRLIARGRAAFKDMRKVTRALGYLFEDPRRQRTYKPTATGDNRAREINGKAHRVLLRHAVASQFQK
jgi:hypothetical protein